MSASPPPPVLPDPRLRTGAARLASTYQGTFAPETVEHLLADSYERLAAGATVRSHLVVLAERLVTERLDALAHTEGRHTTTVPRVLFVCTGNAGRSQMAAALIAHHAGNAVQASSAGTRPAGQLDDHIAEVLAEHDVPLAAAFPKPLTEEIVAAADVVVTMGCGDACPLVDGHRYLDWSVPDPDGAPLETVRAIRDQIDSHVQALLAELAGPTTSP